MIDTISSQGFLDGVLSSEQSFGLLITRFRSVWIHFLLHAFPQITENKAAKHGSAFGLLKLSAFHLHLRPRDKVALWSVLIQASLDCNFESTQKRRSRSHWKPNWQLVWKELLTAYACRCLQGTRDCGTTKMISCFWCSNSSVLQAPHFAEALSLPAPHPRSAKHVAKQTYTWRNLKDQEYIWISSAYWSLL